MKLVLATGNTGKVRELSAQLAASGVTVLSQREFVTGDAVEDGLSFVENALIKARHAAIASGLPAVADDSGLRVDALDGAPGVRSARYAGENASDADNCRKLLSALDGVSVEHRGAAFHCSLVFVRSAVDPAPLIVSAEWRGTVLTDMSGTNGFGYDPLFQPAGLGCSAASLAPEEKQRISHRALALQSFLPQLEALVGA